jgi:Domain of unknown function (DUF4386)
METPSFKTDKIIGVLLVMGSVLVLIPYSILIQTFNYPDILRQDVGVILSTFHKGGNQLIMTWWAFAIVGLPLVEAYILLGQHLENKIYFIRWATTLGVMGLIAQMIGLLRWTFVVPVLASNYVTGSAMTQEVSKVAFQTIHQYGGVVLGEHIGQLFTIAWTLMMASAFHQLRLFPKWVSGWGYTAAGIYLLGQGELFATVIPSFPTWDLAGFLGSTLWLIWLVIVGVFFIKRNK